jgi:hypothetical protein
MSLFRNKARFPFVPKSANKIFLATLSFDKSELSGGGYAERKHLCLDLLRGKPPTDASADIRPSPSFAIDRFQGRLH